MKGLDPADVFDLRFVRDARLSPDGRLAVCAVSATERTTFTDTCALWIIDLASGEHRVLTEEDGFAAAPRWSPDGGRIAYVETAEDSSSLMVVPATGGPPRRLGAPDRMIVGAPSWSPDGRLLAVAAGTAAPADRHTIRVRRRVFRAEGPGLLDALPLGIDVIDVVDGRVESVVPATAAYQCTEPRWSPRGDRILFLASYDERSALAYFPQLRTVDVASGVVRDVLGSWGGCRAAEWLPDGTRIVFAGAAAGSRGIPNTDLWVVEADGSGTPECRSPDNPRLVGCRAVVDMPIWDLILSRGLAVTSDDEAYATVQDGGAAGIWRFSLTGQPVRTQVVGGERTCVVLDAHPNAGLLFVATDMARPTDLYLARDGERRLTSLNDKVLADWPAIGTEHLRFTAPDGLDLEGWFVAPATAEGPWPTVLNLHQGPHTSVGHAFRFDLHLLASHGFSVMLPNFRGSAGYGQDFMDAIGDDWGSGAFADHMTAIDAAIERGLADPDRLGLWGASHGGFATAWVVGHTDRFRAAVAEAAVTDFASAYYTCDIPDFYESQFGGRPHEVPDTYRARSPVTYAANCTTPILMLHCENDMRCPLSQAEAFHRAVLDAGGASEIAVIRGGSHLADAMGAPRERLAQNEALLHWFISHLPRGQK